MDRPVLTLSKKALAAIMVILLPVIVIFGVLYENNKHLVKKQILDDITVLTDAYEVQVYQFIDFARSTTEYFASDGMIKELTGMAGRADALSRHLIKNKLPVSKRVSAIYIADTSGRVIAATDPGLIGKDVSKQEYFRAGLSGTSFEESHILGDEGTAMLSVSTPVKALRTGRVSGVLVTLTRLYELNKVLSGEYSQESGSYRWGKGRRKTMEVYVVNSKRLMITRSLFVKNAPLKLTVDTLPVKSCLESNREVQAFYRDYRGIEVAGASACIPSVKWTLLAEIDTDEAFVPIFRMRAYALAAAFMIAGLTVFLYILFYRSVIVRLTRLIEAARSVSAGNYETVVPVLAKDEIGSLVDAFNVMTSYIKARTNALQEASESLKEAQHIASLGSWDWDVVKDQLRWSDEIYRIFGLAPHEFAATYEAFISAVHPDDREFVKTSVYDAFYNKKPYSIDHRIVRPGGGVRHVHEQAEVLYGADGKPVRMIGTVQDITGRKEAEFELKKLSMVIEDSINIIFITDSKGVIEYVNPMFEKVTGYSRGEAIGQTPRILSSGESTQQQYEDLWKTILSGKTWRSTIKNKKRTGGHYWANSVITPIRDEAGHITHFLAVQEDITEKMVSQQRLEYLYSHDDVTGLINRSRFVERLDAWLAYAKMVGLKGAVLMIDVDHFKFTNETYGHALGDEFLKHTGRLLEGFLREYAAGRTKGGAHEPVISRLSGDEFCIFIPAVDDREGYTIAENIRKEIETASFEGLPFTSTVSIGVVIYPDHGMDTKGLLTKVDAAMYRAKELGRNRSHVFRVEDAELEKMHTRLQWKERILTALKDGRFEPWFQPILDIKEGKVHHYEALARMRDEAGNILLPGAFIDIAERFGLIGAIDRMIIEKTMRAQAEAQKTRGKLCFGMNLSGIDLGDEDLLNFLSAKIADTGADPGCLIFEITETAAIRDLDMAIRFIRSLRSIGCHFSLDDFGVGFTSFSYLRRMQVDYIKIDGSFIRALAQSPDDQVFVKAMTDVAAGLRIKSIAEFVENEDTLELLRKYEVDYAQGYLIGKPAPNLLPPGENGLSKGILRGRRGMPGPE